MFDSCKLIMKYHFQFGKSKPNPALSHLSILLLTCANKIFKVQNLSEIFRLKTPIFWSFGFHSELDWNSGCSEFPDVYLLASGSHFTGFRRLGIWFRMSLDLVRKIPTGRNSEQIPDPFRMCRKTPFSTQF